MRDRRKKIELLPPKADAWTITKRQIVSAELSSAIRLFYCDRDFVSAHVLCGAAREILRTIAKATGVPTFWDLTRDWVYEEYQPAMQDLMNAEYNFFKHASRNPEEKYDRYIPDVTSFLIFETCSDYLAVFGGTYFEIWLHMSWMFLRNPKILRDEVKDSILQLKYSLNVDDAMSLGAALSAGASMLKTADENTMEMMPVLQRHGIKLLRDERAKPPSNAT